MNSYRTTLLFLVACLLVCAGMSDIGLDSAATSTGHAALKTDLDENALIAIVRPDRLAVEMNESQRDALLRGIMDLGYVQGFHIQLFWDHFEPSNDSFQGSIVDQILDIAAARGMSVSMGLVHMLESPAWVMNSLSRSQKFTFTHPSQGVKTVPIPWDREYQSYLDDAIEEMASRWDGNLDYVLVSGPASYYGIEANFPCSYITPDERKKLGFSDTKFKNEWKDSIDKYFEEFTQTDKGITLHTGIDLASNRGKTRIPADLRDYMLDMADGDPVVIKLAGLTAGSFNYFPGPFTGFDDETEYTAITAPVRDKENVTIVYEAAYRMFSGAADISAAAVKQLMINGLSRDVNIIEIYREDIWDRSTKDAYLPFKSHMAWLGRHGKNQKNITHDSSTDTTHATNWDTRIGSPSKIYVDAGCGADQTINCLKVMMSSSGNHVRKNLNLDVASQLYFRLRLYLDLTGVSMNNGHYTRILNLENSSNSTVMYIALLGTSGSSIKIRTVTFAPGATEVNDTTVTADEHYVEFLLRRASPSGANGIAQVWIDDTLVGTRTNLNNRRIFDEASGLEIGNIYTDQDYGASGDLHIDEVKIQGHNSYIGPRFQTSSWKTRKIVHPPGVE